MIGIRLIKIVDFRQLLAIMTMCSWASNYSQDLFYFYQYNICLHWYCMVKELIAVREDNFLSSCFYTESSDLIFTQSYLIYYFMIISLVYYNSFGAFNANSCLYFTMSIYLSRRVNGLVTQYMMLYIQMMYKKLENISPWPNLWTAAEFWISKVRIAGTYLLLHVLSTLCKEL